MGLRSEDATDAELATAFQKIGRSTSALQRAKKVIASTTVGQGLT